MAAKGRIGVGFSEAGGRISWRWELCSGERKEGTGWNEGLIRERVCLCAMSDEP